MSAVALQVNGERLEVAQGTTIADLVRALVDEDDPKGVAVAVDRCVVPRSEWATTPATAGSLVEVVSAAAGG
ncbi:MAG TPA: sulfur carrier protein ThiS [Acidimicrobiales bacterium]|nr:sulfur carrier protein ThiS [Acidimicrobiales bacterium]